jgi:hypothetical protein
MKRNTGPRTLLIAFLAALVLSIVPTAQAQGQCSLATAAGHYGGTLTGTLILPTGGVPAAAVFTLNISTAGNISGTEARNLGGDFANETLEGTLTVNSNCTGTASFSVFESGGLVRKTVFSLVFDDNSTELRAVEQSLVLPSGEAVPAVVTADAKKLFSED